jgi:methyltransferase family protein
MPHWLIKSAIHRVISWMPASHLWNEFFQKHVSKSLGLGRELFEHKLTQFGDHLECFHRFSPRAKGPFKVLEIGTGYYPIAPLALFLCGASEVWTFDIAPLVNRERVKRALVQFSESELEGRLKALLPRLIPERMKVLHQALAQAGPEPARQLLERFNIHARVADAEHSGLGPQSIDLVFSSGVLDYIPAQKLAALFRGFRRLLSSESVMSHRFGLQDQSADFDRSLTRLNFLQYSSRTWNLLASPLIWQNRLRVSDYRALITAAGFRIVQEINTSGPAEDLEKIRLAPEFRKYSKEDLLVATSWLVAQPV